LGNALISVTVSSMVCGEFDTPTGARQPGVGLRDVDGFETEPLVVSPQPKALSENKQTHNESRTNVRTTARTYVRLARRKMRHLAARLSARQSAALRRFATAAV